MKKTSLLSRASTAVIGASAVVGSVIAPLVVRAATLSENIAAGLNKTGTSAGLTQGGTTDLAVVVGRFISVALGLLGIILVVLIIYAGFLWMTAAGNDEKVKQSKKILSNAVIGMILIFLAYAITQFVLTSIGTATA